MARSSVFALWIIAVCVVGFVLSEAAPLCMWIIVSFFLFALLDPAAENLKARGLSRVMSAMIVVIIATLIVGTLVFVVGHLSSNMIFELEASKKIFIQYYHQIEHRWQSIASSFQQISSPQSEEPIPSAGTAALGGDVKTTLVHGLGGAVTMLTYAVLTPILCFFFLADRDLFSATLSKLFNNKVHGAEMWERIVVATRAFFVGNLVIGLVSFPVFFLLFLAFGVPSAATLAGLSSLFNLVPFLGAVLVGFLPSVTLLGQGDHVAASFSLYALCVVVHLAVANFVTPKVLGSKVDINSTFAMVALVALGELWGSVGLILGIPIVATIKIAFEYSGSEWLAWFALMMAEAKHVHQTPRQLVNEETAQARPPR